MSRALMALVGSLAVFSYVLGADKKPQPVPYDRGTTDRPVVVEQHGPISIQSPVVVTEKRTDEDKQADAEKAKDDRELISATDKLAWATFGLAFIAAVTGIFTYQSTKLAREGAEILPKLERAYLFVTVDQTPTVVQQAPNIHDMHMTIRFYNHGKTPAILKSLRHYSVYADHAPEELLRTATGDRELPAGLVVGSDKDYPRAETYRLIDEQREGLRGAEFAVYVIGLMKYEDVMGGQHEVGFCWKSLFRNDDVEMTIYPSSLNYFT